MLALSFGSIVAKINHIYIWKSGNSDSSFYTKKMRVTVSFGSSYFKNLKYIFINTQLNKIV